MEQIPETKDDTLSSLADVVAMVPHRMGFHPQNSLVLVLVDADGRWFATARQDWREETPPGRLCEWVEDVACDADHVLVGLYGPRQEARDLLMVVTVCVENVARGWVMHPDGWDEAVPPGRWVEHPLEEVWASPAQLECWSEGSTPGDQPPAHPLVPAWEGARGRDWRRSLEQAREQLPQDTPASMSDTWGLVAWDHVLGEVSEALEAGAEIPWEALLEPLAVAVLGLNSPTVRDSMFVGALVGPRPATPEIAATQGPWRDDWWDEQKGRLLTDTEMGTRVLLGEFDAPPRTAAGTALRVVLEEMVEQSPPDCAAHMLCLLSWMDWAMGRGSMAAAGLERALALTPGHPFATLLLSFVDTGTVPRWLRRGYRPLP
ncbi:DUF4192 family protein [Galactobacter caseinivorans]|uniref:DUF4192 family protein n=1 Tax=Galactobacter caseinivorans TaxID=2676123 RepID=A0A496PMP8_9MICC|nr:DUF4192 family protein [Galactobacter caseinivorans]RKW71694.1 DUF4192 family protein [Galactobacter caseinivorans]